MPKELSIESVAVALERQQLRNPELPFLSFDPDHIRVLMFQPRGTVTAQAKHVGTRDHVLATAQMRTFLTLARECNADVVACPEYSCPWAALIASVEAGIVPADGKLWAIACESAEPDQLTTHFAALQTKAVVVFDNSVLAENGNFVNPLCFVFRTKHHNDEAVTVVLVQTKTEQMGGKDHFEYSNLKVGHTLYKFRNTGGNSSGLIGLLCSDSLNPDLKKMDHELRKQMLILHLQLNLHPHSESFRAYRTICHTFAPRSTEILCLNWASGTTIESPGVPAVRITEPRTILFREADQVLDDDSRIAQNDAKGCYLAYSSSFHTAAFIFARDALVFYFETTKAWVEGAATNTSRTGPRMLTAYSWHDADQRWSVQETIADGFQQSWLDPHPPGFRAGQQFSRRLSVAISSVSRLCGETRTLLDAIDGVSRWRIQTQILRETQANRTSQPLPGGSPRGNSDLHWTVSFQKAEGRSKEACPADPF